MIMVLFVAGGCGSMYHISIDSELFKGKRTIEQHRMVNEVIHFLFCIISFNPLNFSFALQILTFSF